MFGANRLDGVGDIAPASTTVTPRRASDRAGIRVPVFESPV